MKKKAATAPILAPMGIPGLDEVLQGGLPQHHIYLVLGDPGVGKTTLALQFLIEGRDRGEKSLYITLTETREEIEEIAASHGWNLDGIEFQELAPGDQRDESTLFHPSEIELTATTQSLLVGVERFKPTRIVFDSLSEIRLLSQNPLRYRKQILQLKRYFVEHKATVLLLDDRSETNDLQLHSLPHGVLEMEQMAPEYGGDRRRLRFVKIRGHRYSSGYHDYTIETGGLQVYPRLVAAEHKRGLNSRPLPSGVKEIDDLLGGGIDRGSSTLIIGPAGAGKSVLANQFARAAALRGESVALFMFDESIDTMLARSDALKMGLRELIEAGSIIATRIDPAELAPGEFIDRVRKSVTNANTQVVIIDSINGYLHAMPREQYVTAQLHELLTYLGQHNVATFILAGQHGLLGHTMVSPIDVSYLADTVVLLRFFEAMGEVHKAVSIVKKRSGKHEKSIREMTIGDGGIQLSPPLTQFHGVLSGVPELLKNGKTSLLGASPGRARKKR